MVVVEEEAEAMLTLGAQMVVGVLEMELTSAAAEVTARFETVWQFADVSLKTSIL